MDTGEHGKHKPVLQSIYSTMKCTWAGLLEEKPVVHTGAILAKSIPNNDQVYERPMHQHEIHRAELPSQPRAAAPTELRVTFKSLGK